VIAPSFPPLMSGQALAGQADPFEQACQQATLGCDAGLILHHVTADRLRAAIVFAPELALRQALAMLPACGLGLQNALGALAPPEVSLHLEWSGGLRLNGGHCGSLRCAADTCDADAVPNWLVVGFDLALLPTERETGHHPEETTLFAEGCGEIGAQALLESWARHTLHWITRWEAEGNAPLHAAWRGLLYRVGEDTRWQDQKGHFLGVDENFGMLLRQGPDTRLVPLTTLLETD